MNEKILTTIKNLLGLGETYDPFDAQILVHINAAFAAIAQIGAPVGRNTWVGAETTWEQILNTQPTITFGDISREVTMNLLMNLVHLKVWLMFDPPTSGIVTNSVKERIQELEFRVYVCFDPKLVDVPTIED